MRHFDQLADDVRDGLFHLAPESFDRDSERQVLANALGATLYVPATKDGLAVTVRRQAAAGTRSMVIDLEDAIADDLGRYGAHHHQRDAARPARGPAGQPDLRPGAVGGSHRATRHSGG